MSNQTGSSEIGFGQTGIVVDLPGNQTVMIGIQSVMTDNH